MSRSVRAVTAALLGLVLGGVGAPASAASAVRPVEEQNRIDYLLGQVKTSSATFLRNGGEHKASRAASHLSRKLRFAGKRVQTVREFIVGIASKSEESGKPYEIRWPDGRRQRLAEWLTARLAVYEKEHPPSRR
ncbi:MAG: DUF5329 domain-containing protein [Acidobacteriota bacterium]|nr:DUF5329 domain-containing protein [Acidobacteriota bacterium]MDQ5873381.1 DUF5329 domain-containing protein [Acidobacteriota bacterium]